MSNVRLRRLAADFERMQSYVRRHPRVKLLQVEGSPPEKYQLQYVVRSLRQIGGEIREADSHTVEIVLPRNYPRTPPQCRMLTPVFHPNVAPHAICVGDHWGAGEPLESIVVRIGEMLAYQSYNVKSPLNGDAARWVEQNLHRIPTDKVSMLAEEAAADPATSPAGGPAPSGYPTAAYPAAAPAAPVADVYRVESAPPQHYPQQPYPQQPAYPQQPYAQQPFPQQPYQQPPQYPQQPAYPQQPYAQQPYPQPPYQQQPYPQQPAYPQQSGYPQQGYPQQGVQPPGGIPPMSQPPAPPQPAAAQQPSSAGTAPQAADRIKVSCPGCGKTYVVPASNRGRTAKCQNCQHSFTL